MSARKIPSDAGADGDACWACLLAHLLRHISFCISSLALSLSPSSPAHRQTSALERLLDRLLLALPQQQHDPLNQKSKEIEVAPHGVFPSSLVQLDIYRVLLFSAEKLRALLSTVAQSCGNEAHEYSACVIGTREEVGLLDEREVCVRDSQGCLERLLAFFPHKSSQTMEKEAMDGMEVDGKELSKRFMEAVSDLQKYSDHLEISLRKVTMELSSTVALMTNKLTTSHHLTICSTTAYLRMLMRSFLYAHQESPLKPNNAHPVFQHGDERLNTKAEVVIEQLLNPQGPRIVGLGGSRGLGKTSVASHVARDERISAKFPGGIIYLRVGREPDLTSLQSQLWKQMWGGSICYSTCKATFSNPEEGTAALASRAQEWLPCLLMLDDVWDAAHVQPFLCFDSNDRGRVLVVSSKIDSVLADWKHEIFVLVLEPLDEEEASCLFKSIAECQDLGNAVPMAALIRNCAGNPRLIEAAASIVYYEKARAFTLPSVSSFIKQEARLPDAKMVTLGAAREGPDVGEGEENPEQQGVLMSFLLDSNSQEHNVFFEALAEVHPCLQECFLDLAAFPKGKWVSFSAVLDVWSFGNRMEKERALLVLCFLASRSLVEWKVEEGVDNEFDEGLSFHWRLADNFYELAQALIQSKLKEGLEFSAVTNKEENKGFGESEEDLHGRARDVNGILGLLRRGVKALDTLEWLNTKQNISSVFCLHQHRSKTLHDVLLKFNTRRSTVPSLSISLKEICRFYFPRWQRDQHTAWWNKGEFFNKPTKLSLISSNLTDFPAELKFSKLKVLLLSSNVKLKSIPESTLKCMEHLVVLDLKHCASLTLLPDSICSLHSLEVLELTSCIQLLSLPQAIGKLKSLRYLCLSGCFSLTCLPMSVGSLMNLVMLDLSSCSRLRSLPKTLGNLSFLQMLNLSRCYSLQCLPASIASLRKLHRLIISGCGNLSYNPPAFEQLMNMVGWRAGGAMAVPSQLWKLSELEVLHLCSLKNLICLPPAVGKLQHLRHLNLSSCRSLDYLPEDVGSLFLLEKLDLSYTALRKLPTTLGQLSSLVRLCLRGCSRLLCIPPSLCGLPKLECLEMAECWDFVMLPTEFGNAHAMPKLTELDLSGCSIKSLPCFEEGAFPVLHRLCLSSCQNLSSLPDTFGTLTSLERMELDGCKSLASLHNIGIGDLKQLQWINIRNCVSLSNLPVSELLGLQSLKCFDVSGCTKLSPFPETLLQCAREHRFTLIRWGTVWH